MLDGSEAKVREESVDRGGTGAADLLPAAGRRLVGLLRLMLRLGVLVLLAATFMPLFHPLWPLASVAEHFALQILVGAVLLAVLALGLRHWRWLGLVIAIALLQLWIIHPYWPRFAATEVTRAENTFKVVSLNVHYRNGDYEATRRYLAESGADVIGLVEVTEDWKHELASLASLYPYRVDCIGETPRCEEMLLSKHPFRTHGAGRIGDGLPVMAWAEIAAPAGTGPPVTFAVTHVIWPLKGARPANPALLSIPNPTSVIPDDLPDLAQSEQGANLIVGLQQFTGDLVLMGDFNGAPWSRVQQHLRIETGLDNQGFLAPSWPAWGPAFIRLPIDHVLTRGGASLTRFTSGPDVGSDHLPVEAIISFQPQ